MISALVPFKAAFQRLNSCATFGAGFKLCQQQFLETTSSSLVQPRSLKTVKNCQNMEHNVTLSTAISDITRL